MSLGLLGEIETKSLGEVGLKSHNHQIGISENKRFTTHL